MRVLLRTALVALALPALAAAQDAAVAGQATYDKYCSQCHGDNGDGQGIATRFVKPAPRDFTACKYKIRMTPTGSLPTDDDIRQAIRRGLYYSAMPAFPPAMISDPELDDLVDYLKSFCDDFGDPEAMLPPIEIPAPPPYTPASVEQGREVYAATGCARCHGELGRGDGLSAPTLVDDWGRHIRIADLTMPWTFRGGGSRRDIFRTMSTGFMGTPMPGFHGALPVADIWSIVDFMVSLSGGPQQGEIEAPYDNVVRAVGREELDLALGAELFADAPRALLPVLGQIIEPGRNFYPSVYAVGVRAVYNQDEIAFQVTWHDMRAETAGSAGPELQVPTWDQQLTEAGGGGGDGDSGGEDDFWGVGEVADEEQSDADFWGVEEESDDTAAADDDFWGVAGDDGDSGGASGPDTEFNDAVAIQLPLTLPAGVRKPYFLFGDAQNPVELWFADLGTVGESVTEAALWTARGSAALAPSEDPPPSVVARYDQGQWSVIFKRARKSRSSLSFEEGVFVPIALSVWDGFNRERGNKRGLTRWSYLYLEPLTRPSPRGPMTRAFFGFLGLELLIVAFVRYRHRKKSGKG